MRIENRSRAYLFVGCMLWATVLALGPRTARAQLADCTIEFDISCPTLIPECGALFTGGFGCAFDLLGFCYDTGVFSYRLDDGQTVTITLSDDLNELSVFFTGFGTGTGEMRFFDGVAVEVDAPLLTNGNCGAAMPPKQVVVFSRAVRSIEVTAMGGRVYLDTFQTNPACVPSEPGTELSCKDGIDNDCDGLTDCADPDCQPCCGDGLCAGNEDTCNCAADCGAPPAAESACADGIDEDCDGLTDEADPDCFLDCPFTDDFERATGNTVGNGWVEAGGNPGAIAIEFDGLDTYCLLSRNGVSITQSVIDTTGLSNISFDYDWRDNGATDAADSLIVQWKPTADASFITLATHVLTQATFLSESHTLPASAENTTIDIRFLTAVSSNFDGAHVDNVDVCGGVPCPDADGDGSCDGDDGCPADPSKTAPGQCGCGNPDTDTDGDATPDCLDACPNEPALVNPSEPGTELTCNDGIDNDCDGLADAADPDCAAGCPFACGDINGSGGNADLVDFAAFALCFNKNAPGGACPDPVTFACSDLDGNGSTNLLDFATFTLVFGTSSTNVPPNCP